MTTFLYVRAGNKNWGPYTADQITQFIADGHITSGHLCFDAATGPAIVTISEFFELQARGKWPIRKRRRQASETLKAQRDRLQRDREEFEAYRRAETERLKSVLNGFSKSLLFEKPDHPDDGAFHGRVLGLRGKITRTEIKAAYRKAMAQCHPDFVQTMHPDIRQAAEHLAKTVNAAYEYFDRQYGLS